MTLKAQIPYGAYWSTPFAKWQGSFANLHSIEFAAHVARSEMERRKWSVDMFDFGTLGLTVPQTHCFYGLPWLMGLMGASTVGGPTVMQACATGTRALLTGAAEVEMGLAQCALVMTCDRTSNGPHLYYPNPNGMGGAGTSEDWMIENFSCDPLGKHSMIITAENVAKKYSLTTAQQHEVVLRREQQYAQALADDSAFLKRFMQLPFEVPVLGKGGRKRAPVMLAGDEGLSPSTAEGLAKLKPVLPDGTVTFGGQTHPADGNAAVIVTTADRARSLSSDPSIVIKLQGFGLYRAPLAFMPEATIGAARKALEISGRTIGQIDAIKTHNPFAVNDLCFAKAMGVDVMNMNNYGSSLVWGHPQAPMGTRSIIELIEELVIRGGGWGLFTGCAAGDTAMACVIEVNNG